MKIYISGKISNTYECRERLKKVQKDIERNGDEVINPAAVYMMLPNGMSKKEQHDLRINLMKMCDGVIFLNGFEDDILCNQELSYAILHKYSITFEGGKI